MHALIAFALRARVGIAALVVLALIVGTIGLRGAPYDVLPEFVPPEVTIQTEAPGFDPEQVERLVTRAIESEVNGSPGLATMRSESIAGLSVVTLTFDDGSDAYRVRQGVAEKLANVGTLLPSGVQAPQLSPLTSATMDVLKIGLVSDRVGPMALRTYAETVLRPALLGVPGVARANVFGGDVRELRVDVDAGKLLAAGVSVDDVANALRKALQPRGGGFIETSSQRLDVRVALDADAARLAAVPIAVRGARSITVGDVANVGDAAAPAFGDALIDGRPGVLMTLSDQFGANTLDVTRGLEQKLADLKPDLARLGITLLPRLHRPATFVETALSNLSMALALGALFVAVVLLVFLRDWRAALVSFIAIPLSLLAAAATLWALGFTLNTMTLGGFAVALGVLVDDAIIDVENIVRRLRERGTAIARAERLDVVLHASLEVRSAMTYATIVVLLVFAPAILQPGVSGRFIAPLAWAFVLSVLASLLVALIVTPAMSALFLSRGTLHAEPRWIARLRARQAKTIASLARHTRAALMVLAVAFVIVAAFASRRPTEFIPDFREGHFVAQVTMRQPGVSLDEMRNVGIAMSAALKKLPFVATVEEQMGRAEAGEDTWTVDRGEFHIELAPNVAIDQAEAQKRIRDVFDEFPSVESEVLTFIGDRLSETLTGENSAVVVQLYGEDLEALDQATEKTTKALSGVLGVIDVHSTTGVSKPGLRLKLDVASLSAVGLDPDAPAALLEAATQGAAPVGSIYEGERAIPVVVRLAAASRDLLRELPRQLLPLAGGGYVPFGEVASLEVEDVRPLVRHEAGRRYASVAFNVENVSASDAMRAARAAIEKAGLPPSVHMDFGGIASQQAGATKRLLAATFATLVLIGVILAYAFERRAYALLVLLNLPFALIGALLALLVSGLPLSLGAAVGLVTVFGISARNAILLLTHYEQLLAESGAPMDLALAQRGAAERLVPVTMTALVSALGLLPLALGAGHAGYEIESPLAIVVLGGLATSTLLSLVLLPALAVRWRGGAASV